MNAHYSKGSDMMISKNHFFLQWRGLKAYKSIKILRFIFIVVTVFSHVCYICEKVKKNAHYSKGSDIVMIEDGIRNIAKTMKSVMYWISLLPFCTEQFTYF